MQFNRTNTRGSLHQVQRDLANRSFCLNHPVSAEQSPFRELPGVYEYNYGNKQISKGLTSAICLNAIFLRGIPCSIISLVKALTMQYMRRNTFLTYVVSIMYIMYVSCMLIKCPFTMVYSVESVYVMGYDKCVYTYIIGKV